LIIKAKAPVRIDFAGGWTDCCIDAFTSEWGGAVLSATIDKYVTGSIVTGEDGGVDVHYQCGLPAGCGLGTSSALNVVLLSLVKGNLRCDEDRATIAQMAHELERRLGIKCGKQDQFASALGGFNFMRFGGCEVDVERLQLSPEVVRELEQRLVLCYTGKPRLSGGIHQKVTDGYASRHEDVTQTLHRMREIAVEMRRALTMGRFGNIAYLLNLNWECQKRLDESVTNEQIEDLFEAVAQSGAIGGKACGAGGGGCIVFLCQTSKRYSVMEAVKKAGCSLIPFRFEFDGLVVNAEAEVLKQ
jgi:D-glycero-alpha-D-manno-heptose-7-phosphate kinase